MANKTMHPGTSAPARNGGIPLTIAVIHHHVRGYPEQCISALVAAAPRDAEILLLHGASQKLDGIASPRIRAVQVNAGDRASAKNIAITESRGEFLLMTTSDVLARPDAIRIIQTALAAQPNAAISAQILAENGTCRATTFPFPSLWRELNLLRSARRIARFFKKPRRPHPGPARATSAFAMTFVMARKTVFEAVGGFSSGFRFAREDLQWCGRAHDKGIRLLVAPEAQVFKVPPQLYGALQPGARVALEEANCLLAGGIAPSSVCAWRTVRKAKALIRWVACGSVNALLCHRSELLGEESKASRAIWKAPLDGSAGRSLPPEVESDVRWEG